MPFIFQNSSYVLSIQAKTEEFQRISEYFTSKSVRSINCQSIQELSDCVQKIRFLAAVFVADDVVSNQSEIAQILREHEFSPNLIIGLGNSIEIEHRIDLQSNDDDACFESTLTKLVPNRLDELMMFSMNQLLPSYIQESNLVFSTSAHPQKFEDYDIMTVCHIAAEPYVGQGVQYCNLSKLVEFIPELNSKTEEQRKDFAREMLNQFLGLMNRSLLKLDLITSIGVPEQHEKERVSTIRRTGPYLPMVYMFDSHGIFMYQTGFVHRDGRLTLDLSQLHLEEQEDDIDFF